MARRLAPLVLIGSLVACETTPTIPLETITITDFECGDNCYIQFTRPGSDEVETALCHADACTAWAEWQELPLEMVGRQAQVLIGVGEQVDGDGAVMSSDFPAVLDLEF